MTTHNSHHKAESQHSTAVAAQPVSNMTRYAVIGVLLIAAFFGAYKFAEASRPATAVGGTQVAASTGGSTLLAGGGSAGGGGCCGGGGASGPATSGTAKLSGGVQTISVDASRGYNPNTIVLKAGVPAEITFGQSSGCTAIVYSSQLGFQEDLSSGPKTVKLPALKAGTYGFSCGMNMVTGQIVVK